MKTQLFSFLVISFIVFSTCSSESIDTPIIVTPVEDATYYPPTNSDVWEANSPTQLGYNESQLQPLLDYLEEKNTKGFIILHNGKLVVEHYFNDHTPTSPWYWASAGKTLTSSLSGIAQDEGIIDINNKVSDYLGTGWTSTTSEQEDLITCKNLLSMNSGLDDSLGDSVAPEDLHYLANANTRWAYHNVYVKIQDVVAQASNTNWSTYFNEKLRNPIGMSGAWIPLNDLNVYWSTTRSMARFGLLISENGKWEDTQIISESFLNEATNTSQNINQAYGYLWWLNGKSSFHLPQTQAEFSGALIPSAPQDLYAALGKNDQKIYIVPSKKLVVIRMGEAAEASNFALSSFDNVLWQKINAFTN